MGFVFCKTKIVSTDKNLLRGKLFLNEIISGFINKQNFRNYNQHLYIDIDICIIWYMEKNEFVVRIKSIISNNNNIDNNDDEPRSFVSLYFI